VKANLFLGAGLVRRLTGSELFGGAGGIWRRSPALSLLFLLPALALAGMPPLSGFWAKLLLVQATLASGRYLLTFAVLATGLLTLFAMARLWSELFWAAAPADAPPRPATPPAAMVVPLVALTALVALVGLNPGPFIDTALLIGESLLDPSAYIAAVLEPGR
jgi:multicomponent Na+:H+ antiporter subunit D